MRTLIFSVFLSIACTFTGSAAIAQTRDGVTPAEESVCDALKADGVTKGLYGLCVAYCEAEAHSENVLENYNRKRAEDDPEMPCVEPPTASCPCWTAEMLQAARDSGIAPFCAFGVGDNGDRDEAIYLDVNVFPFTQEAFAIHSAQCAYIFDTDLFSIPAVPGDIEVRLGVSAPEQGACRADVASLCL